MANPSRTLRRRAGREDARDLRRRARELGKYVHGLFRTWLKEEGEEGTIVGFEAWLEARAKVEGWSEAKLAVVKRTIHQVMTNTRKTGARWTREALESFLLSTEK